MEEGDNVLCTVRDVVGITVFVTLETGESGSIVVSEIAPGRIRNLRDYVVPNKKIVCKILRIDSQGNINLSLRRVSEKEKKEVLDKFEREKNATSILKSVIKEKAEEVSRSIKTKESSLYDFLQNCKSSPEKLEKYLGKADALRVCQILLEKKEKLKEIKQEFSLKSDLPNGILITKKILLPYKQHITYLAAGKFVIKIKSEDYKKANKLLQEILTSIEAQAKKDKLIFEVKQ